MRRAWIGAIYCCGCALSYARSESCASSPEAAARALIGTEHGGVISAASEGFRAHDVLFDPVLRRVWVRVMSCVDSNRPLVLVAVGGREVQASGALPDASSQAPANLRSAAQPVVHGGEHVLLAMTTESLHMSLQAVAETSAAVGESLTVTLLPATDSTDPPRHLRAVVTGAGQVEVLR